MHIPGFAQGGGSPRAGIASARTALAMALATLFAAASMLLFVPTQARAAVIKVPPAGDPTLSKTATNLDDAYESQVTLSVSQESGLMRDAVYVIDASSREYASAVAEWVRSDTFSEVFEDAPLRIAIVVFGTNNAPAEVLLPLTLCEGANVEKIAAAFDAAAQVQDGGTANLEAAIGVASDVLDSGLADVNNDGERQAMVLVTDGMITSWGTSASQTFTYADGSTEPSQGVLDARKGVFSKMKSSPSAWLGAEHSDIDAAITTYGNGVSIPEDKATSTPTSLEAGLWRAACAFKGELESEGPSSSRVYLTVFDRDCTGVGEAAQAVIAAFANLTPENYVNELGYSDSGDPDYNTCASSAETSLAVCAGMSSRGLGVYKIGDVMGYGIDDAGDPYSFSLVEDPATMSLAVTFSSGEKIELSCSVSEDLAEGVSGAVRAYQFSYDVPGVGSMPLAALYYLPQGLNAVDEVTRARLSLPGGGGDATPCFLFSLPIPGAASVELTYRVRLDDPQTTPGTYGTYDEDGSEGHEGLLTNESARLGLIKQPIGDQTEYGDILEFPRPTVSYEVEPAVVTPADITVYMGGDEGNDAVLGPDGSVSASGSLPEPGFYVTLPDEANAALEAAGVRTGGEAADLSGHIAVRTADGSKSWALERYGDEHSGAYDKFVYRIVPAEGQDPVRMLFSDEGGSYVSDEFDPAATGALSRDYAMTIYGGDVDLDRILMDVTVGGETRTYTVRVDPAELRVRYVTGGQADVVTGVLDEGAEVPSDGRAHATVPEGTKFYINDSQIDVTDAAAPSLLFDDVVSADNTEGAPDYGAALMGRATDELASFAALSDPSYEARYLDLVDANNGNAWLRSSNPVTVYWPYPEGTDESTEFHLAHFAGLDREMAIDDVDAEVAAAPLEEIEVENTPYGIRFTTDGFSPFVLAWDGGANTGLPTTGDPSWLFAPLAALPAGALALVASHRARR